MNRKKSLSAWINQHGWLVSGIVVVILACLAYLPNLFNLGVYRDDWHIIFGGINFGPGKFVELFSIDRPFIGWNFYFLYHVLSGQILNWHLAVFFLRIIGGLIFLVLIYRLWPTRPEVGLAMGTLFIVYPGFLQQADAITYITHQLVLVAIIFSLLMTVLAVTSQKIVYKIFFYVLGVISAIYYLLVLEYVVGIEGLRIALLIYLLYDPEKDKRFWKRIKSTIYAYIPFAFIIIAFLSWRLFFFKSERITTNVDLVFGRFLSSPIQQIITVIIQLIQDFIEVSLSAWFVPLYNTSGVLQLEQLLISFGFGSLAIIMMGLLLRKGFTDLSDFRDETKTGWAGSIVFIGAFGLISSILPVIVSGRNVLYDSILTIAFDRYTFHALPAAIFLVVGVLFSIFGRKWRTFWICLLVGMAVITQLNASSIFANSWEQTKQFWWQLSWRAPQLRPGTMLIAGFGQSTVVLEEYQVSYPGSLIYYPEIPEPSISSAPYLPVIAPKVIMGVTESAYRRLIPYTNDFKNTLIAYLPNSNSCLHVIDGRLPIFSNNSDPLTNWLAPYSKIDQIDVLSEAHLPPIEIFGREPVHTWCYYYQSASLAAQIGDWKKIDQLAEQVNLLGLTPADPSEWWPFILAHANLGEYDKALLEIYNIKYEKFIQYQLCKHLDENEDISYIASPDARIFLLKNLCTR